MIADGHTRRKWDRAAGSYDFMVAGGQERRWAPVKRTLFSTMGTGPILFVALGTGLDIARFPPDRDIMAIDISPAMLERAAPRVAAYPGRLRTMVMDVRALDFPDAHFDQVFTACTFCSVPDPVRGLRELRRVLRPGGTLGMFEHTGSRYFSFQASAGCHDAAQSPGGTGSESGYGGQCDAGRIRCVRGAAGFSWTSSRRFVPASPSEPPRGCLTPGGMQELEPGGFSGADHPSRDLQVLTDLTWQDATGERHADQTIFEAELAMIRRARRLIVADQFLYNPWRGAAAGDFQPLCARFTDALVAQRRRYPALRAVLITDPVNTAYGAEWPPHLQQLQDAGVEVVLTPLKRLADSNPAWSWLWRTLLRHLALDGLGRFPHPFKPGRVRLATYLRLLHFKANHRKTLIADEDDHWVGSGVIQQSP